MNMWRNTGSNRPWLGVAFSHPPQPAYLSLSLPLPPRTLVPPPLLVLQGDAYPT